MLLDEALDILDCISFLLVNDESLPLDQTELMSQLDALQVKMNDMKDQSLEPVDDLKDQLIKEEEELCIMLKSKRDQLQMIVSAIDGWAIE